MSGKYELHCPQYDFLFSCIEWVQSKGQPTDDPASKVAALEKMNEIGDKMFGSLGDDATISIGSFAVAVFEWCAEEARRTSKAAEQS